MKIRELLSDESKWTQGAFARTEQGASVPFGGSISAARWCLLGATECCYSTTMRLEVWARLRQALRLGTTADVGKWNDDPSRTFADVRALIERLDI